MAEPSEPTYRLACHRRFAYGVGHVLNDLCASMWFSYLLVFFHNVINFSNEMAGYLMLLGQVADAIATPLVGYESDRTNGFCGYTKRKSWHIVGTICVAVSFPFLFMNCIGCSNSDMWAKFLYYSPFVVIFQIGWASTQISHLSLIPELTPNNGERVELNAVRYAFTVVANVMVYSIAWLLFDTSDSGHGEVKDELCPDDAPKFTTLAFSVVGIGMFFTVIFHLGTKEKKNDPSLDSLVVHKTSLNSMTWTDWLKEHQFYQIAVLYMCTRLAVNLSQIYMPMFLTDSLGLNKEYIAIVPLVIYLSGFLTSFCMRPLNRIAGRKMTYFIGSLLIIGACTWNMFVRKTPSWEIFGSSILLGAGCSTILVTSLSMTADLIGDQTQSGAFVYGAMSLTDKLSNGIAVVLIQHLHPCKTASCCPACVWYYRDMIVFVPGGVMILGVVVLITLLPQRIGCLRKFRGMSPYTNNEGQGLLSSRIEEDSNSDDCCGFQFCLGTSKDEQAKIIETSCSSHDRPFHSSYNSFNEYNPSRAQSTGRSDEPVSGTGSLLQVPGSPSDSLHRRSSDRDSPSIHQPSIHSTSDNEN